MTPLPPKQVRVVSPGRCEAAAESGFVLLSVLFLVALILLSLAVAAPRIADEIRRDRENEFYHRGLQYQRAIRMYYKQSQGHYPNSIDQLEKSNNIRFLRQRYKDPMTGSDQWRIIRLGQAKVPPMGFFGQPLTLGVPAAALGANMTDMTKADPGVVPIDPNHPGIDTATPQPAGGATDSSGVDQLGGGPIVGVSSNSDKASIRTYRKQTHYNQWEFTYDPSQDKGTAGLAPPAGTNPAPTPAFPGAPPLNPPDNAAPNPPDNSSPDPSPNPPANPPQ